MRKVIVSIIFILSTSFIHGQGLYSFMLDENFYNTFLYIGDQYYEQEKYDSALLVYIIPFALISSNPSGNSNGLEGCQEVYQFKRRIWGLINLRMGQVNYYLHNYKESIAHLKSSEYILNNSINSDHLLIHCYYFLGLIYLNENHFEDSQHYFYKILSLQNSSLSSDSESETFIAQVYGNIGNILTRKGELKKGLVFYNKSLAIMTAQKDKNRDKISILINNIGSIYYAMGDYTQAIKHYKKAILLLENSTVYYDSDLSMFYHNLAGIYSLLEVYDSSETYYLKGLRIRHLSPKDNDISISQSFLQLSILSYFIGEYDSALIRIQKAINLNLANKDKNKKDSIIFDIVIDNNLMASSLYIKALIFHSLYFLNKCQINYYQANKAYDVLLSFYDYLNENYMSNQDFQFFTDAQKEGIGSALDFHYRASDSKDGSKNMLFKLIERGKAIGLLKILLESKAKKYSNIPDSLIQLEKKLMNKLVEKNIEIEIAKTSNIDLTNPTQFLQSIESQAKIRIKIDTLIEFLQHNYEEYYDLKYNINVSTINEIRNHLDDNTAIIEYYFSDSSLYTVFISDDVFEILSTQKRNINEEIDKHLYNIRFCDNNSSIESGKILYNILLFDIEQYLNDINKIIIIPDEQLFLLPFETLVTNHFQNSHNPNYIIFSFEICYQYSSSIWRFGVEREMNEIRTPMSFMGIAPFATQGERLEITKNQLHLPYSKKEIQYISNLFNQHNYNSIILLDSGTSKKTILDECTNFSYIHFATHGNYNKDVPELSSILLGSTYENKVDLFSQKGEIVEKNLYVGESYGLNLSAKLVTLSSCKSGLGNFSKAEGLISLTRGFLYSGARNILFSVWNINDKHTFSLTTSFYTYLLLGDSPSLALKKAKIELLSCPETSLPIFWAGFLLIGS